MCVWTVAAKRGAVALASILLIGGGLPESARGEVLLNEILYDPDGGDAGSEFVELYNAGPAAVSLEGMHVEFANGAEALRWQTRWTGTATDSLAAGAFWLIVDEGWSANPPGDAEVSLGLQNGPDAVRLLRPGGTDDRLGYGDLAVEGLAEGVPHPGAGGGRSLARRPDGADTDDNTVDWVPLPEPTPGGANFQRYAAEVVEAVFEPPSLLSAGEQVAVEFHVRNSGLDVWSGGHAVLAFGDGGERSMEALPTITPDSTAALTFLVSPPRRGSFGVTLALAIGAEPPAPVFSGTYQVGDFELYLNEVMFAPAGGGEWFEVGNAGVGPVPLATWRVRDEDGDWLGLPELLLAPGDLLVIARSAGDFEAWWAQVVAAGGAAGSPSSPVVVELPSGWPTLNNTPPQSRTYADRLHLAEQGGAVRDHVEILGTGLVPAGRSLERRCIEGDIDSQGNWRPATNGAGATPGFTNSVAAIAPAGVELGLEPNPFRPGGTADVSVLHIRFALEDDCPVWQGEIYDLWGRRVRDLGGDRLGAGSRDILWDGCDDDGRLLSPGGYIVLIRTFDDAITPCRGTKGLAVLAGEWLR